ncbi:hypothetical protein PLESTF_000755800 [Pleodorina starrii]|nr:hypothetical protein PLESTF_000755800 [Pleodorina starrii]
MAFASPSFIFSAFTKPTFPMAVAVAAATPSVSNPTFTTIPSIPNPTTTAAPSISNPTTTAAPSISNPTAATAPSISISTATTTSFAPPTFLAPHTTTTKTLPCTTQFPPGTQQ